MDTRKIIDVLLQCASLLSGIFLTFILLVGINATYLNYLILFTTVMLVISFIRRRLHKKDKKITHITWHFVFLNLFSWLFFFVFMKISGVHLVLNLISLHPALYIALGSLLLMSGLKQTNKEWTYRLLLSAKSFVLLGLITAMNVAPSPFVNIQKVAVPLLFFPAVLNLLIVIDEWIKKNT